MRPIAWHTYLVLVRPTRIRQRLAALCEAGIIERAPSLWQIELGILRMWYRVLFRFHTVGTCVAHAPHANWRARLLRWRPLRAPFLVKERAIAPLDHSGLGVAPERIVTHLLAAHHDGHQFAYDLAILRATPWLLEETKRRATQIARGTTRRERWLRDLTVFEGYHENLVAAVDATLEGRSILDPSEASNPDIGFEAYIQWCLAQPESPRATWRAWRQGGFPCEPTPAAIPALLEVPR